MLVTELISMAWNRLDHVQEMTFWYPSVEVELDLDPRDAEAMMDLIGPEAAMKAFAEAFGARHWWDWTALAPKPAGGAFLPHRAVARSNYIVDDS